MPKYFLALSLLFFSRGAVFAEYFVIDQFDIRIRIDESGYFEVTETIDVTFSEARHGIYRTIPYRFRIKGRKYDISIYDISAEGRAFRREREGGVLRIRIGHPDLYVEGRQRYILTYKVKRAWLFEEGHTEFYWNLTGNEWEVPISALNYRIQLPENLSLSPDDYQVFTGYAGQQGSDASARWENGILAGSATRPFAPGEGLTIAIRLPVDFIRRPSELESFLHHYGLLGIPGALLGLLGWLFLRYGRDEPFAGMAHYYPPEGLPPAEAGAFIDDKTDNRDVISLLPYWGGQGYLAIREIEEKFLGIFSSTDFEFSKLKSLPAGLSDYEYTVFNRLFRDGDEVRLSDLKDQFHTTLRTARSQVQQKVRNRKLHTPQSRMAWGVLPVAAVASAVLGLFFMYMEQSAASGGMFMAAVAAVLIRRPMLKKSKEGMELYRQLYGFRMFVDKADRSRIERLLADDPGYFEKTLPFAIAFGMAKSWAQNFEGLFGEPPGWYSSSSHQYSKSSQSFESFASSFDAGMQKVQSSFSSSPGSSGGGGGSSGGGFGGGGGGSW